MSIDIRNHPDAPDLERIDDVTIEPIPREVIRDRLEDGQELVEDNLTERDDLDARLELSDDPGQEVTANVGTALYRYVQLFGTPQWPGYFAGDDISDREDTTFKYLFRATVEQDDDAYELPDEWLFTVHDWHVNVGASYAEWREDGGDVVAADNVALTTLHVAHNLGNEPVECEYESIWF